MAAWIDQMRVWIESVMGAFGYPGLIMLMILEMVFPPIPSGVVLPMAGFLVAQGSMTLLGVVLAATFGSVVGALVLYSIGRWAGEPVLRGFVRRYGRFFGTSEADFDRALQIFARYGDYALLMGPVIPMLRSVVILPAGMAKVSIVRLIAFTALGSAVWSTALAYAGSLLGANWPRVLGYIEQYQGVTTILLVVAVVLVALKLWHGRRSSRIERLNPTDS